MESKQTTQPAIPDIILPSQSVIKLINKKAYSNESLSTEELSTVVETRTMLRSQIDTILRLLPQLEAYKRALPQLRKLERSSSFLVSVLRDLPEEILRKIFSEYAVEGYTPITGEGGCWTLERVCKRWRMIACGHREIWSRIYIFWEEVILGPNKQSTFWLQKMLQRAGTSPLHIKWQEKARYDWESFLVDQDSRAEEYVKRMTEIITMVLAHSAQWKSVELSGTYLDTALLDLQHLRWDALRKVKISQLPGEYTFSQFGEPRVLSWLKKIPNLYELEVKDVDPELELWPYLMYDVPAAVRRLRLESWEELLPLLNWSRGTTLAFGHLQSLDIECGAVEGSLYEDIGSSSLFAACTMPHLLTLCLSNVPVLIRALTCPLLKQIDIRCWSAYQLPPEDKGMLVKDLEEFLDRSNCHITSDSFACQWNCDYPDDGPESWSIQLGDIKGHFQAAIV